MGWNEEKVRTMIAACEQIYNLHYELKNCVRGSYTDCQTYTELGKYAQELGKRLMDAGYDTENEPEDEDYE